MNNQIYRKLIQESIDYMNSDRNIDPEEGNDIYYKSLVIPKITEINKLGLLTTNGQAPYNLNWKDNKTVSRLKGWIEGYYPRENIDAFLKQLDKKQDLRYMIVIDNEIKTNITDWEKGTSDEFSCLTKDNDECRTRLWKDKEYYGDLSYNEDYGDLIKKDYIFINITMKDFCNTYSVNVENEKRDKYCSFTFMYDEIIKALKDSQKTMSFGSRNIKSMLRYLNKLL